MKRNSPKNIVWVAKFFPDKLEKYLIQGYNPNVINDFGYAPIHHTVSQNNLEATRTLLIFHSNPNLKSIRQGNSPLHYAKDSAMTKLLLEFGANPFLKNRKGEIAKNKTIKNFLLYKCQEFSEFLPMYLKHRILYYTFMELTRKEIDSVI